MYLEIQRDPAHDRVARDDAGSEIRGPIQVAFQFSKHGVKADDGDVLVSWTLRCGEDEIRSGAAVKRNWDPA